MRTPEATEALRNLHNITRQIRYHETMARSLTADRAKLINEARGAGARTQEIARITPAQHAVRRAA